ncbi:endoplasmic reticulum protein ERp29, C-terminal domain-containing protein [Pisolithus sp. B1]|nr:endoplasmic reticulum protein ERp29, C-terminal domain-containing protein [Pisolithus sp. B1]
MMRFSLPLFLSSLLAAVVASNVLDLGPDNFDAVIGKGKPGLVEFGHCKSLAPTYEQLADAFSHAKDKVVIAKVDADGAGRPLGQKYEVSGLSNIVFSSALKWFDEKGNAEAYEGGRDLDALATFVSKKSGIKSNIKPPPPPATLILDAHTFDDVALDNTKDVLVTFTSLKPIYEQVARDFKPESNVGFNFVLCFWQRKPCSLPTSISASLLISMLTPALNKELAGRYGVASYPTIKFFPRGGKEVEDYEGARTEEAFVNFLNEKCGTNRAVGGGLNDQAGRLAELDAIAQKFLAAVGTARDVAYKEGIALSQGLGSAAQYYVRVMERIVKDSEAYIDKESKRLASILNKRTLASAKLDEIKIKLNILKAFVSQKLDDAEQEEVNTFGKATAEL